MAEPRYLDLKGVTLEQFLGHGPAEPLPNIAGFKRLKEDGLRKDQLRGLLAWIEPQYRCNAVIRFHGSSGLGIVLRGIAEACVAAGVPLSGRVEAFAGSKGIA